MYIYLLTYAYTCACRVKDESKASALLLFPSGCVHIVAACIGMRPTERDVNGLKKLKEEELELKGK